MKRRSANERAEPGFTVECAVHFGQERRGRKRLREGEQPITAPVTPGNVPRVARLLALAHRSGPAEPIDVYEMFDIGWPGEKAGAEAAADRVYWVIGTLRRLGLRDLLVTTDDGYHLARGTRVVFPVIGRRSPLFADDAELHRVDAR